MKVCKRLASLQNGFKRLLEINSMLWIFNILLLNTEKQLLYDEQLQMMVHRTNFKSTVPIHSIGITLPWTSLVSPKTLYKNTTNGIASQKKKHFWLLLFLKYVVSMYLPLLHLKYNARKADFNPFWGHARYFLFLQTLISFRYHKRIKYMCFSSPVGNVIRIFLKISLGWRIDRQNHRQKVVDRMAFRSCKGIDIQIGQKFH